ncbi:hypothetical protein JQK87_24215 [Streptomyces sp. G44]|uniref:thioesterase domain-containing protein n=1 Tax=Streptomyces sp. G44 TaxID=2807632 RepID=UPI0019615B14|nr:thioesterase domain-containing protein [Streptomyces sp. G44]MBM7171454.1 hypothetical protein [Streptomyces sp. G44]
MPVDWEAVFAGHHPRRVPLPTYAFERRRYWLDPAPPRRRPAPARVSGKRTHPFLTHRTATADGGLLLSGRSPSRRERPAVEEDGAASRLVRARHPHLEVDRSVRGQHQRRGQGEFVHAGRADRRTGTLEPVTLAPGGAGAPLICFPSLSALSGPHEYGGLGAALRELRPVTAVRHPGFEPGEALPATLDALLTAHVTAVRAAAGQARPVLLGRSAGGWVAQAVAERMAAEGSAPAALVLVDTYPHDADEAAQSFSAR